MPIFAYLATPKQGALQQLNTDLNALPHCEVITAENENVLVLVTDTPGEPEEKALQQRLRRLDSLQSLSMTFGHSDIFSTDKP